MQPDASMRTKPVEITGRMVLLCLIAFFAVVAAVNAVLMWKAVSTFGGVETENAYSAGLNFGRDVAAARMQDALHWHVDGHLKHDATGATSIEISVRDENDAAIPGLAVQAALLHPTDRRLDHPLSMIETARGAFRGVVQSAPGQWDLVLEMQRDSERLFRSRSRIIVR